MADPKKSLLKIFDGLKPEQKKKVVVAVVVSILVVFAYYIYKDRGKTPAPEKAVHREEVIALEPKLLQQTMLEEQRKALADNKTEMDDLRKRLEEYEKRESEKAQKTQGDGKDKQDMRNYPPGFPPMPGSAGSGITAERAVPGASRNQGQGMLTAKQTNGVPDAQYGYPPIPAPLPNSNVRPSAGNPAKKGETGLIGDIEDASNAQADKKPEKPDSKKKAGEKIYLPPSFMEATLLSGLAAQTTDAGKESPSPVILRVANVAVLPNEVKANLKGCFVIGEGHGKLSTERVDIRLTSLSCLAKDGKAVIDQKIKGFVVDADGNIGLAGKVVAKMGAMLSRSLLAGFFQGLGDAVKAASLTSTISPLGTTQTVSGNEIGKEAVGSGIAQAAHDLQKFYLDLAKNTLPVIEVGATKRVTVVISEGVDLDVKIHCDRSNELGGVCSQSTEVL
jgi:conjugal transfer pilus assembly protein TraB